VTRGAGSLLALAVGLAGAGCDDGLARDTQIDDLRLVALKLSPCEQRTGVVTQVSATIADPAREGARFSLWICPAVGDCEVDSDTLEPGEDVALTRLSIPGPGRLWALACAPEACDPDALTESERRDPERWLARNGGPGVSAASADLAPVDPDAPPHPPSCLNPTLADVPASEQTVSAGAVVGLVLSAEGAGVAWTWTTAGSFPQTEHELDGGVLDIDWSAPRTPGAADLFVVFGQIGSVGPDGDWIGPTLGVTVWIGHFTVE